MTHKNLEDKLHQTEELLNSLEALGFKPQFNHTGGYQKYNGHIIFGDGNVHIYYNTKEGKYRGNLRKSNKLKE